MSTDTQSSQNLRARAWQAMLDAGFAPDFPTGIDAELRALEGQLQTLIADQPVRDLRSLLWSSIDNRESRDLDQVEFAQRQPEGDIQLMLGIADVDVYVLRNSRIDRHAALNTTSVYTGIETFPMLPEQLSTDLTSLIEGRDRLAFVIDLLINGAGEVKLKGVYHALIHNYAKLDYESVGRWLEGRGPLPDEVSSVAELEGQLRLQWEATERLRALRQRQGALDFETTEASPVTRDGKVVGLAVQQKNPARYLIENFMIAANTALATYLRAQGLPAIQRVVRTPARWPRIVEIAQQLGDNLPPEPDTRALADFLARRKATDPEHFPDLSLAVVKLLGPGEYAVIEPGAPHEGHFGLAVQNYTHSTAPNRRYADLVTQRLLKAVLAKSPIPYETTELREIAQHCMKQENAARKVERLMRKLVAATLLSGRLGEVFDAIVTGASDKGTYVRLLAPPAEGRVIRGELGLDVGDRVQVRLLSIEPAQGFIDFERAR